MKKQNIIKLKAVNQKGLTINEALSRVFILPYLKEVRKRLGFHFALANWKESPGDSIESSGLLPEHRLSFR